METVSRPTLLHYLLVAAQLGHRRLRQDYVAVPEGWEELLQVFEALAAVASGAVPSPQESSEGKNVGSIEDDGAMSRQQAARFLGISVATLDRLARAGDITPVKIGRRVLFEREQLAAFLEDRR